MSATQRLRVSLIGVLSVIMAVVWFVAPATATPYTHHRPTTSVSSSHPDAGSTVTFCGAGFKAGESVTITVGHTRYASVTAGSDGVWCTGVALSPRLSGNVKLTAASTTTHRSSSTRIHIDKKHGDRGRGHGNDPRLLAPGVPAGSGWFDRVLGLGVTGGPGWFDRVLDRA